MPPGKANLDVYQGDDYELRVAFIAGAGGPPVNLTGLTFAAQIRLSTADNGPVLATFECEVTDAPGGLLTCKLPHEQSVALRYPQGAWDLEATDGAGDVTTYLAGTVKVTPEKTRAV